MHPVLLAQGVPGARIDAQHLGAQVDGLVGQHAGQQVLGGDLLRPDGSHLSNYFGKLYRAQGEVPRHLSTITWSTLNIFLAGAADVAHAAVYNNDMGADLAKIEVPLLVIHGVWNANPLQFLAGA